MTQEEFRVKVMSRKLPDKEIAKLYLGLIVENTKWRIKNRFDKDTKSPLEYIANGDALEFIKTHRPELYVRLTGKESAE